MVSSKDVASLVVVRLEAIPLETTPVVVTKPKEPKVFWVVTEGNDPNVMDDGELGVEIDGVAYFYYKWPDPSPAAPQVKYRQISKREFGEVIRRPER